MEPSEGGTAASWGGRTGKERWGCSCSLVPTTAPADAMEGRSQAAPLHNSRGQKQHSSLRVEHYCSSTCNIPVSGIQRHLKSSRLQLHLNWAATQHSGVVATAYWWPPLLARRQSCRLVDRPLHAPNSLTHPGGTRYGDT